MDATCGSRIFAWSHPELRAQIDGTLALIRSQPSIDVRISGDSDLPSAAKWWGQADDAPRGSVHVAGTVSGPLSQPEARLQLTSSGIAWQRLEAGNISAIVRVDRDALEVGESRAAIAGGDVTASGGLVFEAKQARLNASWRGVDAARLVAAIGGASVTPSGRASGEVNASGSTESIEGWRWTRAWRSKGGSGAAGVSRHPVKRASISRRGSGGSMRDISLARSRLSMCR